jgi:hypothetical protein
MDVVKGIGRAIVAAIAALVAMDAGAEPLHDHDNGPLSGYFGIPDATEGSNFAAAGTSRLGLMLMTSSHSILDGRLGEAILLDGETSRLEFTYRRGIGSRWEIGAEIPYVWHESGGLDQLVTTWHDSLGFPGGFRETRQKDRLDFIYLDEEGPRLTLDRNVRGVGDLRLIAGYKPFPDSRRGFAVRFGVKLPTGDSDRLLGSGGTDLSVGIAGDLNDVVGVPGLSAFYRLSAIYIGEPDQLAELYRDTVGYVSLGFGYRLGEVVDLRLQGAIRTAVYDSAVEVLGDPSGTLTFGAEFRLTRSMRLAIGISEDVKVRSAPDVTFQASLRYRPR